MNIYPYSMPMCHFADLEEYRYIRTYFKSSNWSLWLPLGNCESELSLKFYGRELLCMLLGGSQHQRYANRRYSLRPWCFIHSNTGACGIEKGVSQGLKVDFVSQMSDTDP